MARGSSAGGQRAAGQGRSQTGAGGADFGGLVWVLAAEPEARISCSDSSQSGVVVHVKKKIPQRGRKIFSTRLKPS